MADTRIDYNIIIYDVRDPEITWVYVRVDPSPGDPMDCDHNIYGWHAKAFPARIPTAQIGLNLGLNHEYNPLAWPKQYPEGVL